MVARRKSGTVLLRGGLIALIDEKDWSLVRPYDWYPVNGCRTSYALTKVTHNGKRKTLSMHRLIMGDPPGIPIDHRDGNGLNNRRANLRPATNKQNLQHKRPYANGTSPYKGVSWSVAHRKWRAQIMVDYKKHHIGWFTNEIEAARAYDTAATRFFGEFAWLNFPDETKAA